MTDIYMCTCGFESESEVNAIKHAAVWHASESERNDLDRLKRRIRTMIYNPFREFSFDEAKESA
jgi:hypothetical protein